MTPEEHREVFRDGWNAAISAAIDTLPQGHVDPQAAAIRALRDHSNYNAPFCHHPEKCGPVGRCLREIACND